MHSERRSWKVTHSVSLNYSCCRPGLFCFQPLLACSEPSEAVHQGLQSVAVVQRANHSLHSHTVQRAHLRGNVHRLNPIMNFGKLLGRNKFEATPLSLVNVSLSFVSFEFTVTEKQTRRRCFDLCFAPPAVAFHCKTPSLGKNVSLDFKGLLCGCHDWPGSGEAVPGTPSSLFSTHSSASSSRTPPHPHTRLLPPSF